MNKPTILVIAPTPYFSDRGCHIRIFEELKLIQQLGYQAELVTYPLGRTIGAAHIIRTAALPWYRKTTAGPAISKLWLDLLLIFKARRVIRISKPKFIHAHLHEGMLIAKLARFGKKLPIVLDLQSVLPEELHSYGGIWKWLTPLAAIYERWAVQQADQVLVSSDQAFQALSKRYPQARFELLRDGIGQIIEPQPFQYDLVYSGGIGKHKGTDLLLQAIELVKQSKPDLRYLMIAPGYTSVPYEKLLATLAACRLGIDPKPPTTTEGSGKLLNYMAAGVTPIYFSSASTLALTAGLGVPLATVSADALAAAIESVLNNPMEPAERQALQQHVSAEHSWSAQRDTLQSIYARLHTA